MKPLITVSFQRSILKWENSIMCCCLWVIVDVERFLIVYVGICKALYTITGKHCLLLLAGQWGVKYKVN